MILSQKTKSLLSEISSSSGNRLMRSMDLGTLIELAHQQSLTGVLDDLAFAAKFLSKSFDLMKKVGKGGEGYDKLETEFSAQMKKSHALINQLLEKSDAMTKAHFAQTYLSMDTVSLQHLMQLFHDLSWYKNYLIDQSRQ